MPTTIISMVLKTSPKISERGRKEKKNELQKGQATAAQSILARFSAGGSGGERRERWGMRGTERGRERNR